MRTKARSPEIQRLRDALAWRLAMRRAALRIACGHDARATAGKAKERAAAAAAAASYRRDADRDLQCAQQLREQLASTTP